MIWERVQKTDPRALALADRHYSRQTPGARYFTPPGQSLVLVIGAAAVWAAVHNLDPRGRKRWRVTIFRNEGAGLSSELIRAATLETFTYWRDHYGAIPAVPLRTEVDPSRVRAKRDPGRCFRRAGWIVVGRADTHRGPRLVLQAPEGRS